MKPPEDIKRYFKKATLSTNQNKHEAIFEKILIAHEQVNKGEPVSSRINIGRIIMRSPISKLAAVLVIIMAILIINLHPGNSGYLWAADLAEKVGSIQNVIYRSKSTSIIPGPKEDTILEFESIVYYSLAHGYREEVYKDGEFDSVDIINTKENKFYGISHSNKRFEKLNVPAEKNKEIFTKEDPRELVKEIMSKEYKKIGKSTINDIEVEGIECVNQTLFETLKNANAKLWVDIKTELPVRIEYEEIRDSSLKTKWSKIMYDFQWNVDMDKALFFPEIPSDYKISEMDVTVVNDKPVLNYNPTLLDPNIIPESHRNITDMNTPLIDQETMIQYLKDYAEFTGGFYPKNMQYMTMAIEMTMVTAVRYPDAMKELSKIGEKIKSDPNNYKLINEENFLIAIAKKAKAIDRFYAQLVVDNKEPKYYPSVLPKDIDKILLRWKVTDNNYRIIFGDLKADTATYETLVELEKTLPEKEESEN